MSLKAAYSEFMDGKPKEDKLIIQEYIEPHARK
jgi:hypothetical protein